MPKTDDGGFLLDDSELEPYKVDKSKKDTKESNESEKQ